MPAIARSEPFREQACPLGVCDGSGWILGPEDVARPCECRAERLNRGRSRGVASAIPARYRGVSFDRPPVADMARDMESRHVVQAARTYARGARRQHRGGQGALVHGQYRDRQDDAGDADRQGRRWQPARRSAIYFTPKLLTRIRQTYQEAENEDAYAPSSSELTSVDLLYIDDLGSERHTDWVVEQLYAVVNERYENQRPMIVTSNADDEVIDRARSN